MSFTYQLIKSEAKQAEIKIYGYIGVDDESALDYVKFESRLRSDLMLHDKVTLRFHCFGGSVYEGLAIYDLIKSFGDKITGVVDGIAASIASVMFQGCNKRIMSPNARIMIHKPSVEAQGESHQLRDLAAHMDALEQSIVNIFKMRTGQQEKVVKKWLQKNYDTWLTAEQCLELGLCDEISSEPSSIQLPEHLLSNRAKPQMVWNALHEIQIENSNMKKPLLTKVFNAFKIDHQLNEQSSDDDFVEVVKNVFAGYESQIKDLNTQLATQKNTRIEGLISNAIALGKLTESDRETYTDLAKSNFESTEKVINSLPAKKDVMGNLVRGAANPEKREASPSNVKDSWSYRDWETKDPKGLAYMRSVDKEKFDKLFQDYYGADQD